jgi:hypothetical protein
MEPSHGPRRSASRSEDALEPYPVQRWASFGAPVIVSASCDETIRVSDAQLEREQSFIRCAVGDAAISITLADHNQLVAGPEPGVTLLTCHSTREF